jgi:hypothetical protein
MADGFDMDGFAATMTAIEDRVDREFEEIFGTGKRLTDAEFDLVFNMKMDHREKMAKLRVLRAERQVKPKSFAKRITRAGRIHAHAMGIEID